MISIEALENNIWNYTWIFVGVCLAYLGCWYAYEQYVAVIAANVVFLALFCFFDYARYVDLDGLTSRRNELLGKSFDLIDNTGHLSVVGNTGSCPTIVRVTPSILVDHKDFSKPFKLDYLVEESKKFVEASKAKARNTFFVAFFLAVLALVAFSTSKSVPGCGQDMKLIVTAAGTFINAILILMPLWSCRERNRSALGS